MNKIGRKLRLLLTVNITLTVIVIINALIVIFIDDLPDNAAFKINALNLLFILVFIFNCVGMFESLRSRNIFRELLVLVLLLSVLLLAGLIFANSGRL